MVKTVAIYDKRDGDPFSLWYCKQGGCSHSCRYGTVALFHQHDAHGIQMRSLEVRTCFLVHKTEAATDAGSETQNGNT